MGVAQQTVEGQTYTPLRLPPPLSVAIYFVTSKNFVTFCDLVFTFKRNGYRVSTQIVP